MSEEQLIMESRKSAMVIVGDLLKFPWLFLLVLVLLFWVIGESTGNYYGLLTVFGMYAILIPIKYLLNRKKFYTLTTLRSIYNPGNDNKIKVLYHEQIDYVNIQYPIFGKTLGYGHIIITYNHNKKTEYKNVKDPFNFAKELTEAVRYAKAQALKG